MSESSDTIIVTLDADDFRRLVRGETVVVGIAGQRVKIVQEDIGARDMIAAVLEAMGDDPREAREFLSRSGRE